MHQTEELVLLAELQNEHCGLNHGPGVDTEAIKAVDYIVIPIGKVEETAIEEVSREMVIPVCAECLESLKGNEWTLAYCLECNASQWICREKAKNKYRHHILWIKGCPDCGGKFGGFYTNDMPEVEEYVHGRHIRVS